MSSSKQAKLGRQHENTWADLHRRVMSVPFDYEELFPINVHNFIRNKAVSMSSCTGYFVPCLLSTTSFVLGLNSYISNGSRSFPCNMFMMVIQARRKLFAIGGAETEGPSRAPLARVLLGGSGGMLPREIFKSRVWEMPFHGLWGKDLTEF